MQRITLVPRDQGRAVDATRINRYLEARDDVQRLDSGAFVVEISSADLATQAEVHTGRDGEPIHRVNVEIDTGGIAYGSPLMTEVRRLCEDVASRFGLVVKTDGATRPVAAYFDDGGP
jgi:hypothetical protein